MYRNTLLVFLDVISLTKQVPFPLIDIVQRIESELFYSLFACQPFVSTLVPVGLVIFISETNDLRTIFVPSLP